LYNTSSIIHQSDGCIEKKTKNKWKTERRKEEKSKPKILQALLTFNCAERRERSIFLSEATCGIKMEL